MIIGQIITESVYLKVKIVLLCAYYNFSEEDIKYN